MQIGLLEYRDNDFITSVAEGLSDLAPEFITISDIHHPAPSPYGIIIDRVSFADAFLREVMRYWSASGAYVLNNPFYTLVADKMSDLQLCSRLGIPHPKTVLLPRINLTEDMREIVLEPDWARLKDVLRFPCILKPVDGYAWQDVFRADSPEELIRLYDGLKGRRVLMVQELITWSRYYRAFCIGPEDVLLVHWTPRPLDLGEYTCVDPAEAPEIRDFMRAKSAEFNRAAGLDFNSIEWCVTPSGKANIIDSLNDVPDVRRDKIPEPCYRWIINRFCARVRGILDAGEKNSLSLP
jgi:hypothetical protein